MKRLTAIISFCLGFAFASVSGCVSVRHNNAARLIEHADFDAARSAAPEWCRDALKTINALEYELERK